MPVLQGTPVVAQEAIHPAQPHPAVPAPPKKTKKKSWFVYALGALLLAAVGTLIWRTTAKPAPPSWTPVQVSRGTVTKTINATGKVEALTTVSVGSQASGTVAELYVD